MLTRSKTGRDAESNAAAEVAGAPHTNLRPRLHSARAAQGLLRAGQWRLPREVLGAHR